MILPPTHVLSDLNVFLATDVPAAAAVASPFPSVAAGPRGPATGGLSPSCVFGAPDRKNRPRADFFLPQPGGLGVFPPAPPVPSPDPDTGNACAVL